MTLARAKRLSRTLQWVSFGEQIRVISPECRSRGGTNVQRGSIETWNDSRRLRHGLRRPSDHLARNT